MSFQKLIVYSVVFSIIAVTPAFAASKGIIKGSDVRIRSEASTSSQILGKENQGKEFTVVGKEGDWFSVSYNGNLAYVSEQFFELTKADASVSGSGINIRSNPDITAEVKAKANNGDAVVVVGQTTDWYKLEDGGYISKEFVQGANLNFVPMVSVAPIQVKDTEVENTEVENTEVEDTEVKDIEVENTEVENTEDAAQQPQTPVEDTQAAIDEVEEDSTDGAQESAEEDGAQAASGEISNTDSETVNAASSGDLENTYGIVTATDGLRLRTEASTDAKIMRTLSSGEVVDVLQHASQWLQVKTEDGAIGYVSSDYCSVQKGEKPARSTATAKGEEVAAFARKHVGTRYRWGGTNLSTGVDCSGFVYAVYKQFGVTLNRSSASMASNGVYVAKSQIAAGDLVFFDTSGSNNGGISHVGIYLGGGKYIHSSTNNTGVIISNLNDSYGLRTYVTARRIIR